LPLTALTASLVKRAATLRDGGFRYHSWVGVSVSDQAKSSPSADQISAVSCWCTKIIPAARMVSTTVLGAEPSARHNCSVASSEADSTQSSSIQASPVTVPE
jgi:hypothetical protein